MADQSQDRPPPPDAPPTTPSPAADGEEPIRSLEKKVRVEAPVEVVWRAISEAEELKRWFPLDARVTRGEGEGAGRIWLSFGPGVEGEAPLHAFEAPRHLGWTEGPAGSRQITVDFHLEPAEGGTVVRLVQSGFGPGADWDDYYEVVSGGWSYFLLNLRHYLERHPGRPRTFVWRRHPVSGTRVDVWERLFAAEGIGAPLAVLASSGEAVELRLGGLHLPGSVLLSRPPMHFAAVLPELDDGLILVELEGSGEAWHLGVWISLYGAAREAAPRVEAALAAALGRVFPGGS
jgi:uncharacterized protein YndB with AHSA1/START domain